MKEFPFPIIAAFGVSHQPASLRPLLFMHIDSHAESLRAVFEIRKEKEFIRLLLLISVYRLVYFDCMRCFYWHRLLTEIEM